MEPPLQGINRSMRIAWIADTFDGLSGGVVSSRRFVSALRARGHEVTVVTTGEPGPGRVSVRGFQVPIEAMRRNEFSFGLPSRRAFDRAIAAADVVHVAFGFALGWSALRYARAASVPVVASFHVQPENVLYNLGLHLPSVARALYRTWIARFYELADLVICPSRFAESKLRAHGLRQQTRVVSNGAPAHLFAHAPRGQNNGDAPITILSVGRLAREKRPDVVVDAIARSRHRDRVRLVLAGAGPLEEEVRSRVQGLGLDAEIGRVTDERLAQLYASSHLFVHASEVELEGMAVLEAMAAGLPVLVADAEESAAKELASRDVRFRAGDAADLATRIDALLDDPRALSESSARSLETARAYAFDGCVDRMEAAFAAAIAERRGAASTWHLDDRDRVVPAPVPRRRSSRVSPAERAAMSARRRIRSMRRRKRARPSTPTRT